MAALEEMEDIELHMEHGPLNAGRYIKKFAKVSQKRSRAVDRMLETICSTQRCSRLQVVQGTRFTKRAMEHKVIHNLKAASGDRMLFGQ